MGARRFSMGRMRRSVLTPTSDRTEPAAFLPYWTRDAAGHIAIQPLIKYDNHGLSPERRDEGRLVYRTNGEGESILDPLPLRRAGEKRLSRDDVGSDHDRREVSRRRRRRISISPSSSSSRSRSKGLSSAVSPRSQL